MEYYVADTYKNMKRIGEPIKKNGKLYTVVEGTCDRCGGTGIFACRIENGHPVPHPAYGGVCLQCGGSGKITKTVRLYSEREYASMQKAKEKRHAEAEERREARMAERRRTALSRWMERNGFNSDCETYLIYGNTYPIKDDLKAAGMKFSQELKWHGPAAVDVPEDCFIEKVHYSDIYDWDEENCVMQLNQRGKAFLEGIFTSHVFGVYVGEVKERLRDMPAVLEKKIECDGKFGWAIMYRFNSDGAQFVWFTEKVLDLDEGDECVLTGTVKKHGIYGNVKTTYLNRCIVK